MDATSPISPQLLSMRQPRGQARPAHGFLAVLPFGVPVPLPLLAAGATPANFPRTVPGLTRARLAMASSFIGAILPPSCLGAAVFLIRLLPGRSVGVTVASRERAIPVTAAATMGTGRRGAYVRGTVPGRASIWEGRTHLGG